MQGNHSSACASLWQEEYIALNSYNAIIGGGVTRVAALAPLHRWSAAFALLRSQRLRNNAEIAIKAKPANAPTAPPTTAPTWLLKRTASTLGEVDWVCEGVAALKGMEEEDDVDDELGDVMLMEPDVVMDALISVTSTGMMTK